MGVECDVLSWTAVIISVLGTNIETQLFFFISKNLSHCFKLIDCVYRVRLFKVKMLLW